MLLALELECRSIAFPVIGAGTGGLDEEVALAAMREQIEAFRDAALALSGSRVFTITNNRCGRQEDV